MSWTDTSRNGPERSNKIRNSKSFNLPGSHNQFSIRAETAACHRRVTPDHIELLGVKAPAFSELRDLLGLYGRTRHLDRLVEISRGTALRGVFFRLGFGLSLCLSSLLFCLGIGLFGGFGLSLCKSSCIWFDFWRLRMHNGGVSS